jgi:hypothetical protein
VRCDQKSGIFADFRRFLAPLADNPPLRPIIRHSGGIFRSKAAISAANVAGRLCHWPDKSGACATFADAIRSGVRAAVASERIPRSIFGQDGKYDQPPNFGV